MDVYLSSLAYEGFHCKVTLFETTYVLNPGRSPSKQEWRPFCILGLLNHLIGAVHTCSQFIIRTQCSIITCTLWTSKACSRSVTLWVYFTSPIQYFNCLCEWVYHSNFVIDGRNSIWTSTFTWSKSHNSNVLCVVLFYRILKICQGINEPAMWVW